MTDSKLIQLIKKNPEKGMSALMEQYTPLVYRMVKNKMGFVCSAEDVEETVSDVFLTFYHRLDSVTPDKGSIAAYLSVIAKGKAIDRLRAHKAYPVSTEENSLIAIPDTVNLEKEAERKALHQRLIAEIKALGEPDATILILKYYYGETSSAIAKSVGLSAENVRKRAQRALQKLKLKLEGESDAI